MAIDYDVYQGDKLVAIKGSKVEAVRRAKSGAKKTGETHEVWEAHSKNALIHARVLVHTESP